MANRILGRLLRSAGYRRRHPRIENLERRVVLDTGARPTIALFAGNIPTSSAVDSIPVQIGASEFAPSGHKVLLSFDLESAAASAFRPGAIQLKTSSNKLVRAQVSQTGRGGSASYLLASLGPGTYTIVVHAQKGSFGAFQLSVSLAGDVNRDGRVDQSDLSQIQHDSGARAGQARYLPAADLSNTGKINKGDLTLARQNLGVSTSIRPLSVTAALDASSAPDAQGTVHQSRVVVDGLSEPGALVTLSAGNSGLLTTTADGRGSFQFAFDVPLGTTLAQIETRDSFGQQASTTLTIVRANAAPTDTQPPSIVVTSPTQGLVTNANVTVVGKATDAQSGVAKLEVALDGAAFAAIPVATATGAFQYTTNLPLTGSGDGVHAILIRATDNVGNVATVNETFTLDTHGPSITLASPNEGTTVSTSPTVTGQVSDVLSGVASLEAKLDGAAFVTIPVGAGGAFSFAPNLVVNGSADGSHTVTFNATDRVGNVASAKVDFTLDTLAPKIAVTSPVEGAVASTSPTVIGLVSDAGSGVASLQANLDGGAYAAIPLGAGGSFNFVLGLATDGSRDGSHSVTLKATDRMGFVATKKVDFTLDSLAPAITLRSPASALVTKTNPSINGTVKGTNLTTLQAQIDNLAPVSVSFDHGTGAFIFTPSVAINGTADGPHTVQFTVMDSLARSTSTKFLFTLKTVPPAPPTFDLVAGTADLGPETTSSALVTLVGQTEPGVTLSLVGTNFTALASNTGKFQIPEVNLAPGANTLTVEATDAAGNTSSSMLTVTRSSSASSPPNAVIFWNQATLNAIQTDGTDPVMSSRTLAMVQAAVYDAVNNVAGLPAYYIKVSAPSNSSVEAAVDAAAADVLNALYPAQQTTTNGLFASELALLPTNQGTIDGQAVGRAVGNAIIAMRANDGSRGFVDFTAGSAPGEWQQTAPAYAPALDPQAANMTPWAMTSPSQFDTAGPPALTSQQWADAVNQVESLGAVHSTTRTAAETQLAQFWNDGIGTYTPSGHWNAIAETVAQQKGDSLINDARLFAELNVTMADAGIASWNTKYLYDSWRPITVVRDGADGVNSAVTSDPAWTPFLVTPNFPEYVSGHSDFSAAAATVLDAFFGDAVTFAATEVTTNLSMTYTSFDQAAQDSGMSRLYGGIHFLFSIQDGWTMGKNVANFDLATFSVSKDTRPPVVTIQTTLPNAASNKNVTITGQVTDNLSGVATLGVAVDGGASRPLTFDPTTGNFSFTTSFAIDGSADGSHTIDFEATNAAGIVAAPVPFTFGLATKAPKLTLTSPKNAGVLSAGTMLTGIVTSGGAPIVALGYAIDGGTSIPVAFNADGSFSQAVNFSTVAPGASTLVVTAQDAAGNLATQTLNFTLPTAIPLTVTNLSPSAGSTDVSATFRPEIFFSRPIDPTTLTSSDFFATDSSGTPIPATIVPTDDGLSTWLFFTNPLPGSSRILLTVNGSMIKALDGGKLDAAGNGKAGSTLTSAFTVVSTAAIPGTSITGIVADPGPDGQPGTRDDVRSGADGTLGTGDDIYLNPVAGAKVYILGLENEAVMSASDGSFTLTNVPAGDVKIVVDGRTATNAPAGVYYPEMVMDLTVLPGVASTVMGDMGTTQEQASQGTAQGVYLPRLQTSILQPAGGATPTTIHLEPSAATSTLTALQASEYSITVAPNSLIGPDGKKLSSANIGISTVSPSLIREMLPQGVMQLATTLTIQAPGVATFSTPLQVTFANVYNAAPGTQLDVYSFNHTTGLLEITGTATVSADGKTATTDPGSGITHPGWFGVTPPGTTAQPTPCTAPPPDTQLTAPEVTIEGGDGLFTGSTIATSSPITLKIMNMGKPDVNTSVEVDITLSEISEFLTNFNQDFYQFTLAAGDENSFELTPRMLTDVEEAALEDAGLSGKLLSGSIHIVATATIYPPNTVTCDADGNMVTTTAPTSIEKVLDETLDYSELLTVDPNGLDFPVTDVVDATDPQTITISMSGPSEPTLTESGDPRITQSVSGNDVSLTYKPDPANTTQPSAVVNAVAPNGTSLGKAEVGTDMLNFAPIAIRVSAGKIKHDDKVTEIKDGTLEIGTSGAAFQTLATFTGDFSADSSVIKFNGKFTVNIEGVTATLFDGTFSIPRGQAAGDAKGSGNADQDAKLAGLKFELSNLKFADGKLQLQGSLTLPEEWGAVKVAIEDPNLLEITSGGKVSITGGSISFPDEEFKLFGLDVTSKKMQMQFQAATPATQFEPATLDTLKISGDLTISAEFKGVKLSIEADLARNDDPAMDSFIQIEATKNPDKPYALDVVGTLTFMDNFTLPPGGNGFGITGGSVAVNTLTNAWTIQIQVQIPGTASNGLSPIKITGTLGFLNDAINVLGIDASGINKGPLGTDPLWLQSVGMLVNNITDPKAPFNFVGSLGVTLGPLFPEPLNITLPSWTGISPIMATSLASFDGTATLYTTSLLGSLNATFLDPQILSGTTGIVGIDWANGIFSIQDASLSALGGIAKLTLNMQGSKAGGLTGTGVASLNFPKSMPTGFGFLAGESLSGTVKLSVPSFTDPSADYMAFFVTLPVSVPFIGKQVGFQIFFNGSTKYLSASDIAGIGDPAFQIPSGTNGLIFNTQWTNPLASGANVAIVVSDPNGNQTTLNTHNPTTTGPIQIVPSLSSSTLASVVINSPLAGTWTIAVADTTGLGTVTYGAFATKTLPAAPTLELLGPNTDIAVPPGGTFNVAYTDSAPKAGTTVELFLDTRNSGHDGVPVATGTAVDGGGTITVDTSKLDVATGTYHLYALIDDGLNSPVLSNYAAGQITITDPMALPTVQTVQAFWYGGDEEDLTWNPVTGADHYVVTVTDTSVTGAAAQTVVALGQGSLLLSDANLSKPLVPGDPYLFQIQAISADSNGTFHDGLPGGQVVGVVGPTPTVGPVAMLAGEKFTDPSRTGVLQAGDVGLSGVTIHLVDANTGALLQTQTTDSQGQYSFGPLTPGLYVVREVVDPNRPQDFPLTPGSDTVLLTGDSTTMVNFGDPSQGSIAGKVQQDTNLLGTANVPLAGVTVFLDLNHNQTLDPGDPTAVTAADGSYTIHDLLAGTYAVAVLAPSGLAPATDQSVTLTADQNATGVNVVMSQPLPGGPPALELLTAAGAPYTQTTNNFGTVLANAPANAQGVLHLELANYGGQPLTVSSVTFTGANTPFSLVGLAAGATIQPASVSGGLSTIPFSIVFDPTHSGSFTSTLTITTNDPKSPVTIALLGAGESGQQQISIAVPNNNAGGINIAAGARTVANFGTVTNTGNQPLSITNIIQDPQFTVVGMPSGFGPSNPLVLAPGASQTFSLVANLQSTGLKRGVIQFLSNDPTTPALKLHVVATGIPAGGSVATAANAYVAITLPNVAGGYTLRGRTDGAGQFNFFVPPSQPYEVTEFDPISGLIAHGTGTSAPSGQATRVSQPGFQASTANDTGGDGLPDDVEVAVGLSPTGPQIASDGVDYYTQMVLDHLSPTALAALVTGVVSTAALNGSAQAVTLQGSLDTAQGLTAYVATGSSGLAVVDVSNFQKPIVRGQIQLPGNSTDVAVDPRLQIAAVASGTALNLVDISKPTRPALLQSLQIAADVVRVDEGVAYAAVGNVVEAVDLATGNVLATESFSGGHVDDLGIDQGNLYVLASSGVASHTVYKVVLDGADLLSPAESLTITGHPTFGRMRLFAANGYVYVGASDASNTQQIPGVEVIHDSGTALSLIGPPSAITAFDVTTNGSGLALFTGGTAGLQSTAKVGLLNLADPTNTANLITVFNTPGVAQSVAMADGLGFIADGSAGLAILNYLPFDTKGVPPTASISLPASVVIGTNGSTLNVVEGSTIPIIASVSDDVQVHNVELLINGKVIANAVSAPYDLITTLPTLAQNGSTPITIQVEAIDTGGNVGLSNTLTVALVKDVTAPKLVSNNLPDGAKVGPGFRTVILQFSKPLDESTVRPADFQFVASNSTALAPSDVEFRDNDRTVQLTLPALDQSTYQFTIDEASIKDREGNRLGSGNVTTSFKVGFSVSWINPAGGNWSDPSNWSTHSVPGSGDDVVINVPGTVLINYDQGDTSIGSLVSNDPFTLKGGTLTVAGTVQVNNTFTLAGGGLSKADILSGSGGQGLNFTASGGTLDAVTAGADFNLATIDRSYALVTHGLTLDHNTIALGSQTGSIGGQLDFEGTQLLGGHGTIVLGNRNGALETFDTLTLGSGISIHGNSGTLYGNAFVNQGSIAAVNSGGTAGSFDFDSGFNGGNTSSTIDAIDLSGVASPAPETVYQTYRSGSFAYTLSGLTAGTSYTLRLHFADPQSTAAGAQKFDVNVNGTQVLTDFDIFATAGAKDKAVVKPFTATANSQGQVVVAFNYGAAGTPMVSGIELDAVGTIVQAIDCGALGGTLTIRPTSFTNSGSLQVANGDALTITSLSGNLGAVPISGVGSSLSVDGTNYVVDQGISLSGGQTLSLNSQWSNVAGSAITANGATINLSYNSIANWTNLGSISTTNSTVNLGGEFTLAALGNFQRTGGSVIVTGILDDTGTTLALNDTTGSWILSTNGTIMNGHYSATGGAELQIPSNGTLDGVTADSDLDLSAIVISELSVADGLTLNNATIHMGNGAGATFGEVFFKSDETLGGTGTVLFGKDTQNALISHGLLTLGSGITVRGSSGGIFDNVGTVINQGTIAADDSGGAAGPFAYDSGFSGGFAAPTADLIDVSGVTNPAPQTVYQSYRGGSFTYTLNGLTAGTSYALRLHFADPHSTAAGQQQFNVSVNGTQVLTNFDVFATAGGKDKAVVEPFTATANGQGQVVVVFANGAAGTPMVSGIEVDSGNAIVQAVNCGELAGGAITISASSFTNQGSIQATNGEAISISHFAPNAGVISAGVGSTITVTGAFAQATAGTVAFSIGGTAAGQFGQLAATGIATLTGMLNASIVNGYVPVAGNSVPLMTFTSSTGQFTTVHVSNLPAGISATLVYNAANVTLLFGNALKADAAISAGPGDQSRLTPRELAPVVTEALRDWAAAGVAPSELAELRQLQFEIVNLPDTELGMQVGNTIWIDQDASGHGWFLDAGPGSDPQFSQRVTWEELQAPAGGPAFGKMDLLTVVEHEMGHILGLSEQGDPDGIMGEVLGSGIRRLPTLGSSGRAMTAESARIDSTAAASHALTTAIDHLISSGSLSFSRGVAGDLQISDREPEGASRVIAVAGEVSSATTTKKASVRTGPRAALVRWARLRVLPTAGDDDDLSGNPGHHAEWH